MKITIAFLLSLLAVGSNAFAPPRPLGLAGQAVSSATPSSSTELAMIGGFFQGLFGKKDAEITDTVFFDISIDGQKAGRIEMGLYGSTVPKVGTYRRRRRPLQLRHLFKSIF